jgi:hypothetical protein
MKILYLPLDERPCNYKYPQQLSRMTDLDLVVPSLHLLGRKKTPASFDPIKEWLIREAAQADYLIVSLDMLVYGGIVPSRLHYQSTEDGIARMQILREIKEINQNIRIYAFNLITRVPAYNSSDEEPDYYETYGEQISSYGKLIDKEEQGRLTEDEEKRLLFLKQQIPSEVLSDFIGRRKVNSSINQYSIEMVLNGIIDFLIIPLDDNAEYGFSVMEQRGLVFKIEELGLMDQVAIYPGADEIGCTLLAKVFCEVHRYEPEVFVRYSSTQGPYIIPKYEDRSLNESIKAHLNAIGGHISDHSQDADVVLMVNSPAVGQSDMAETNTPFSKRHRSYFSEVNIREFVHSISHYISKGNVVALADVAVCNGSDQPLMKLLGKMKLLQQVQAYAGWNTSGNTLGTVLAHGIIESYFHRQGNVDLERKRKSREFYYSRLVEDWGYQAIARHHIYEEDVLRLDGTYFDVSGIQSEVESRVHYRLTQFIESHLNDTPDGRILLEEVNLPWNRMFEVGFQLSLVDID